MEQENKPTSVWTDNRFWGRSAGWVTGVSMVLLIFLTFDTVAQISMGSEGDITIGESNKRIPSAAIINHKISYEYSQKRRHEVPIIGEKEEFFGKNYSEDEALALLRLGKLTVQAKNCMNCHTLLGNGAYFAPDLTKAWIDPKWDEQMVAMTGKNSKEEAMATFLQNPDMYPTHARRMPNLGITADEAKGVVAFLKHMASIDTNGFPRNFNKIGGSIQP